MHRVLPLLVALIPFTVLALSGCNSARPAKPTKPSRRENSGAMSVLQLETVIRSVGQNVRGEGSVLQFEYEGVEMICIWDEQHGRMRIIAPVVEATSLTEEQRAAVLESNFHSALDARYATSRGTLYSAYIHPLDGLTARQVVSALRQVATLATTFGTSYSSGELEFGGRQ